MGTSQSKRPRVQSWLPSSSDYTYLPSSPSKQQLLKEDSLHQCNCSEQYGTLVKDILKKNTASEEKVTELERKIERLDDLLLTKSAEMEGNIGKITTNVKKATELEKKLQLSKNASADGSKREDIADEKKITKLERNIERLEQLVLTKSAAMEGINKENIASKKKVTELEKKIESLERLLHSKNAAMEGGIRKLQAEADGLALMSLNGAHEVELDKDVDEPEYVNSIMGAILMLIFVVFVSIGMHL